VKALIVDPDAARAATVADALVASGAQAAIAPSASFALTMLEWNQQDVIISRAQVGDMDGPELCSMIRADPSTAAMRFVLIANGVTPARASEIGLDLVIPEGLIGPAIVMRVMHMMRREQQSTRAAPPTPVEAPAPPPEVSESIEPAPAVPLSAEPAPPLLVSPELVPSAEASSEPALTLPVSPEPVPPLPMVPEPVSPLPMSPELAPIPAASSEPEASLAASEPPLSLAAAPAPVVDSDALEPLELIPLPLVAPPRAPAPPPPPPVSPPPPVVVAAPAPAINPLPKGAAPPPPPLTELESVGMNGAMRTFQGALGSLALEDLTQAIVKGSKTGRLLVVLGTGGGMIAFDSGRIVHAEVGNSTGESAFQSLVAASHRDAGGKFCFIPSAPRDLANVPKTITRSVADLLSGAAQAINEGR
jgi:CheY-like chemotaxis protein